MDRYYLKLTKNNFIDVTIGIKNYSSQASIQKLNEAQEKPFSIWSS